MMRPYSKGIRERALARGDAGEMVRSIAEALQISPSTYQITVSSCRPTALTSTRSSTSSPNSNTSWEPQSLVTWRQPGGRLVNSSIFSQEECTNYFKNPGYASV
ncbi:transposase [Bradyrhizobium elkanii]|nr:transposase [Bradyrhizobium elkanii]